MAKATRGDMFPPMPAGLPPLLRVSPPGPRSIELGRRMGESSVPMGPPRRPGAAPSGIVLSRGEGANVYCADDNRYVDLAAGFGALLLGHGHPRVEEVLTHQGRTLLQALGDVYPSEPKVLLLEALAALHKSESSNRDPGQPNSRETGSRQASAQAKPPERTEPNREHEIGNSGGAGPETLQPRQSILGLSGADALTAALKTAILHTGKSGVVAFSGSYHGLSYGPLALTDLRPSYRLPFSEQLAKDVHFLPYPKDDETAQLCFASIDPLFDQVGAVVFEPIQGRAGVWPAPAGFWSELCRRARAHGVVSIADEVWTGLGRAGAWFTTLASDAEPDLICLGKGLGGGLPISACLGPTSMMAAWSREEEVVHTSTFAGAPLAAEAALATLAVLRAEQLIARSKEVGESFLSELREQLRGFKGAKVRGQGLMVGIDVADFRGQGRGVQKALLERGYLTTSGGGERNVLVLTPALNIERELLSSFSRTLGEVLKEMA